MSRTRLGRGAGLAPLVVVVFSLEVPMKRRVFFPACAGLAAPALFAQQQVKQSQATTHLKVGDKVPDFSLPATGNTTFKLADHIGKKNVVLAFFPAAFTAG